VNATAAKAREEWIEAPHREAEREHQPREQGSRHPCPGAAQRRNRSRAEHEDEIQWRFQRQAGQVDRHGDLRPRHGGVQCHEHARRECRRKAERNRQQINARDLTDIRIHLCEAEPEVGCQQPRQAERREEQRQPHRLLDVFADGAPAVRTEVMTGNRRQRLQYAHEADVDRHVHARADCDRCEVGRRQAAGHDRVDRAVADDGQVRDQQRPRQTDQRTSRRVGALSAAVSLIE
jgi:hypothetical protein